MTDESLQHPLLASAWMPAPWLMSACRFLQVCVMGLGGAVLFLACLEGLKHSLWAIPCAIGFVWLTLLLHESGHAMAAALSGSTVVCVHLGPLEFRAQRRGWRMRWGKGLRGLGGLVQSIPAVERPVRRQMVATIAGGPLANIAVAVACLAAWQAIGDPCIVAVLLGVGAYNLAGAVANLLPVAPGVWASDGLQLLRWWRGIDDDDPQVVLMRLMGRALAGSDTPPSRHELEILARSPEPGPLLVLWMRVRQRQLAGEWEQVEEMSGAIDEHVLKLPPQMLHAAAGLVAWMRCEVAFSRAMIGAMPEPRASSLLGPDMGWQLPAVRLRCEALECVQQGQLDAARVLLLKAREWAARSIDLVFESNEMALCNAVQNRMTQAGSAGVPLHSQAA